MFSTQAYRFLSGCQAMAILIVVGCPGADGVTENEETNSGTDAGHSSTQCQVRPTEAPAEDFFIDVSMSAGIQENTWVAQPAMSIPINDHSRLGFVDLDGDGYDDIVTHSLFPNPQAGIPYEHIVFRNKGDGTFEDFSDASGLKDIQAGFFAFGDVDNDGDQDCFAGHDGNISGGQNQILLNSGNGVFRPPAQSGIEDTLPVAANAIFADFDNDTFLDLFIGYGHTSFVAPDELFWGYGDGSFTKDNNALSGGPAHPTNGSVACDFDSDGDQDIFVSTYGVSHQLGTNILWENQGNRQFVNVAVEKGFASLAGGNFWLNLADEPEPGKSPGEYVGSNGFGLECADVNNDGYLDVFLTTISHPVSSDYTRKWSDPTQILINQGPENDYTFVDESQARQLPFNEGDVDGAVIDFDFDGRMDLSISRDKKYEGNYTHDDQKAWFGLMHQQEDGTFSSVGPQSGINRVDAALTASLDICSTDTDCNDASEACLSDRCRTPCASNADCSSPDEMCHTNGFCKLLLTMKNAQNHAWSDVDHDGDLDLLVGGRDTGGGRPNFLFQNDIGHKNRWIAFRLIGDGLAINADAIGTRVELLFSDRTIVRELHASRGMHNSMDTRVMHFGLGDFECAYTVQVTWPNGEKVQLSPSDFPEETYLTLSYPDALTF